jgi:uncharacterized protein with gpF-like domain
VINLRSERAKRREVTRQTRVRRRFEKAMARAIFPALQRQVRGAVAAVRAGRGRIGADAAVRRGSPRLRSALQAAYRSVAEHFGNAAFDAFDRAFKQSREETFETLIDRFTRDTAARKVVRIDETTRDRIRAVINEGLRDGLSNDEMADMIDNRTGSAINRIRAERIARTEANAGSSFGTDAAMQSTGLDFEREWLATLTDDRTRPTHRLANGQKRPMDKPFTVGGASLRYPSDPEGPPQEVIQCRCALGYNPRPQR